MEEGERARTSSATAIVKESRGSVLTCECSVCCGPAAAHLHYGAISCYSCRLDISHCFSSSFILACIVFYAFCKPDLHVDQCILQLLSFKIILHQAEYSKYRAFFLRGPPKPKSCIFGKNSCKITLENRIRCKLCR